MIQWALEVTNLTEYRDREVSRLSGGQRQRVWIAMALCQGTKTLFLDEPTTYLDIRYQIEIIINGFDRISGPAVVNTSDKAGFDLMQDPGVPYISNISFCGAQTGFDRTQAGKEGKGSLGHSGNELEGMKIAGNTFDYPFIHGKAIQAAGKYSFVSCSDEAVENGLVTLEDYPVVDYILGLEKEDPANKAYYKTFSSAMQRIMTSYCQSGGNLFVSGAYVGSDMSGTQGNREIGRAHV